MPVVRRAMLALVAAITLASPASAAGTLTEYLGALPAGAPVPAGPWTGLNVGSTAGGPFGVEVPAGAWVGWSLTAALMPPPGLGFASAAADRSVEIPPGADTAQGQAVTTWESQGWPYTGVSEFGGYAGAWAGGVLTALNPPSLSIRMSCTIFGGGGGTCPHVWWLARRIELTLTDAAAPTASLVGGGGPLLAGGWRTGSSSTLELAAGDVGAGVYRAFLREGTGTQHAGLDPSASRCGDARPGIGSDYEFTASTASLVPCPTAIAVYAPAFSLTALGDGVHTVDLGVEDASGRETIVATGRIIRVNAPGGALTDPGTPCPNGAHDDSGTCVARAPSSTSAPQLSGSPVEALTLVTDTGAWDDIIGVTWSYAWEACQADGTGCGLVGSATTPTIALDASMVGERVRAVVSATTNGGTTLARSALSPVIYPSGAGGTGGAGTIHDVEPSESTGGEGGPLHRVEVIDRLDLPVPALAPGALPTPNGQGDDGTTPRLEARSAGPSRVAYGTASLVAGRLTTAAGAPIADAQVDVISHVAMPGAAGRIDGATQTDRDGRFTYRAAAGVSRILTFGYRRTLADDSYARVVHVVLRVVPTVTLTVDRARLRNGSAVTFTGAVLGAPPTDGRLVELQVRSGHRWTTFATARLRAGRYAHRYRFTRTTQTTTYRFRTRVAHEPTWPLETAASTARAVEVRR